ncbi:MAG: hypothetical protein J0G35_15195 [Acidobacteriales bacterium]|nr:hypothetical protein [Terriglobales bacterium]
MKGRTMDAAGDSIGKGPTAPHPFARAEVLDAAVETEKIKNSINDEATAGESTED